MPGQEPGLMVIFRQNGNVNKDSVFNIQPLKYFSGLFRHAFSKLVQNNFFSQYIQNTKWFQWKVNNSNI